MPFKLADIGEGIAEVELMKWFVKEGDVVKAFDNICEVQSDKATVEITSKYSGVITSVNYGEGDIVKVGASLVDIDTPEAGSAAAPASPVPAPAPVVATVPSSAALGTSLVPFKLADIGEGIAEVELMKWFVKEGDVVKAFDNICEVQSDKATVEITSKYSGVITSVNYGEGDIVKVGASLVDITVEGAVAGATIAPAASTSPSAAASVSAAAVADHSSSNASVLTTPAVRKIAKENRIKLSDVMGTGPKGRILKADVLSYVANGGNPQGSTAPAVAPASVSTDAVAVVGQKSGFFAAGETIRTEKIRGIQRMMVKSMNAAREIQTFVYADEVSWVHLL